MFIYVWRTRTVERMRIQMQSTNAYRLSCFPRVYEKCTHFYALRRRRRRVRHKMPLSRSFDDTRNGIARIAWFISTWDECVCAQVMHNKSTYTCMVQTVIHICVSHNKYMNSTLRGLARCVIYQINYVNNLSQGTLILGGLSACLFGRLFFHTTHHSLLSGTMTMQSSSSISRCTPESGFVRAAAESSTSVLARRIDWRGDRTGFDQAHDDVVLLPCAGTLSRHT